jgi:hypothetical protein
MSQQINLLNTTLIKQKDFFNPTNIAITLGLMCVLLLGYYGFANNKLSKLNFARSLAAEKLSSIDAALKQATITHKVHAPNKALLDEISQLEQKKKMQQQILQMVKQSKANPDKGYAALMRAFAKQSMDGLWLTNFSFDSQSEKLNISGRTLHADLVPEYISRLSLEPALKGKLFSALTMSLRKVDDIKTAALQANTREASRHSSANTLPPAAPKYIEFALQSIAEKNLSDNTPVKIETKS